MNSYRIIILLLSLAFISACESGKTNQSGEKGNGRLKSELSGNFSISGADALYPLVRKWSDNFMKIHPKVKITIIRNGTGQGIDDLKAKKNQLAMISRPLTEEELSDSIWTVPVAKAGVAPIINQKNPYFKRIMDRGIDPQKLIKLYIRGETMTWGELLDTISKEKAAIYTRGDESGAAVIWANFLWKESSDLKGIKVRGDEEMIKSIQGNALAIGYCNFSYAFDSVTGQRIKDIQVLPIDLDFDKIIDKKEIPFSNINKAHRGLWLGYYPRNLTRELTLGSKGKPTDLAILEFLNYTLTIGQKSVGSSGFCELNDIYIKSALEKIQ
jgi:phosphate transport system substrate-binding protein